ncbi:MAG: tRNA 2-thiouridine(34) synthase MnmA [Patescibacteria group bacterium]|nr:tRNA 2-thiouridine(34) synthase MnmA [Patescibacteria group bacterium]
MMLNSRKQKKVLVALSGGVDSAVCAALLQKQEYDVAGLFMNLGQVNLKNDKSAAQAVAEKLKIPLKIVDFRKEFKQKIIKYFLNEYARGRTPNPCVKCNKEIKFGLLFKEMKKINFDFLATGHYIRLRRQILNFKFQIPNKYKLKIPSKKIVYKLYKAKDEKKDQGYFLYNLKQTQLKNLFFPLGDFLKEEIIEIAKKLRLPTMEKESQDICFLNSKDHNLFLQENLRLKKGLIKNLSGEIIGEHNGLPLYTIGQRRQIKIGGIGPFYVVRMDYKKNVLFVANKFDDKILYSKNLFVKNLNWISGKKPAMPLKCRACIRYLHPLEKCEIILQNKKYKVNFLKSQRAITAGQSVVFYKKRELLGGGIIC